MTRFLNARLRDGASYGAPCAGVLSAFFNRTDDVHSEPHSGVDIAAPTWTPVVAPAAGKVTFVSVAGTGGWADVFGTSVILDHGDCYTLYAHLAGDQSVWVGADVQAGDRLGYVGSTGQSTGPHLHWGMAEHSNRWFDKGDALAHLMDPLAFIGPEPRSEYDEGDDEMPIDTTVVGPRVLQAKDDLQYVGFDTDTDEYVFKSEKEIRIPKGGPVT